MRDFIEWLFDGRILFTAELRNIDPDSHVGQEWYELPRNLDEMMADARTLDAMGSEVYVGVLPRIDRGGKTDSVSQYTNLLWADIDSKAHGGDKGEALDALLDFPVAPNAIVDSGHGYHAYWRLDHLYLFDDVQPIMKGIAKRIGGDAVYDRARILRLPGLSNHKGGGNAPVRLIRFDTTSSFLLSDLDEFRFREEPKVTFNIDHRFDLSQTALGGTIAALAENAARIREDLSFDPGKGARSENDFKVACRLIERGWTDGEVVKAFLDNPQGVGAKTAKSGLRYLERTIAAAHRAVGR